VQLEHIIVLLFSFAKISKTLGQAVKENYHYKNIPSKCLKQIFVIYP